MHKDLSCLKFGEPHCHSDFSDSISSVEKNVLTAKDLAFDALAITDHGTCGGLVEHWNTCQNNDIKPILGTEGYLRLPEPLQFESRNASSGRYHITFWSINMDGYTNLIALNNAAHVNRELSRGKYFPIVTFEMLRDMDLTGIAVGTGCPASVTYHDNHDVADEYIRFLVQQFGKENIYAELMEHVITRERDGSSFNCWERPLEFSKLYDIQTIWSGDVHAATPEDLEHLKILQKATAFEYTVNALKGQQETYEVAVDCVGEEEALNAMVGVDKLINSVEDVQLKVDFELPECEELVEYVKDKILKAFETDLLKYKDELGEDAMRERLQIEWDLNDRWNFWSYFAIVNDLVEFAHSNKVSTTARGSGGGSYILYLLQVTQLNPIKHGLYFERFLCEKRFDKGELPDIDLDFASNKRHLIQEYAFKRWGLVGVCTYLTYSHKSLIRFLGRVWGSIRGYEMDPNVVSRASRYEAYEKDNDGNILGKTESFEKFCAYADFLEPMYNSMLDTISGTGTHACALAIVDGEIAVPVEGFTETLTIAYVESGKNKSLQDVGRVKIDALGLNALGRLDMMQEMIDEKIPMEIEDGDACFSLYNQGATGGLFQFDTGVSRSIVDKNRGFINDIHSLSRMTAKGRPGAMSQGLHLITPDNPVDISYHPEFIQSILEKTYGVCCYQEQVMEIYASVAYPELNSDTLQDGVVALKSLVPKHFSIAEQQWWKEQYQVLHDKFMQGGKEYHGLDDEYLTDFFDSLKGFTRYGFNLPHSLLYANLSARMAWVKCNYPEVFWTVTLRDTPNNKGHKAETIRYFVEATRFGGISISAPTINTADAEYTLNKELKRVQMPLTTISGIGPRVSSAVFNERDTNGNFTSLSDFNVRNSKLPKGCKVSANMRKLLYECGVFDDIKSGNVDRDLLDLGVREQKTFKVRGAKWENVTDEFEIVDVIEYEDRIKLIDTEGTVWTINEFTKTKNRKFQPGLRLKVIWECEHATDECQRIILEFAKVSYVEETPEILSEEKAIRKAYGFTWDSEMLKWYEHSENKGLEKYCGFVCDVEERKTKSTTQRSITLESGKRIWWLLEDRTNNKWLTNKGIKQTPKYNLPYIHPQNIPDISVGDFIGGQLFTSINKETDELMSYNQIMSCRKWGNR